MVKRTELECSGLSGLEGWGKKKSRIVKVLTSLCICKQSDILLGNAMLVGFHIFNPQKLKEKLQTLLD